MARKPIARHVSTLVDNPATGDFRVTGRLGDQSHPANGMTAKVHLGGGAFSSIMNPWSFEDGGVEWQLRYGNPDGIRYSAASLLASYDYLLSGAISFEEAKRRLRILRAARRELWNEPTQEET
jgi:hypothetical protein